MPFVELVAACRAAEHQFANGETTCNSFALELVRRSVAEKSSEGWAALIEMYGRFVRASLRRHPARSLSTEDDAYWVNRTFQRFWMAVGPERIDQFNSTAAVLGYLKLCAHSVLLDDARSRRRTPTTSLDELPETGAPCAGVEHTLDALAARQLWAAVLEELADESERIVARLSLVSGLKPARIHELHPDRFANVADVYQVKRKILERLRRSPRLKQYL
jgi:DNA-directed RNA polymerase specialized sigma24 family protein